MSRRPRRKAFSGLRKEKNIAISMDGKTGIPGACFFAMGWKGCWRDNVFVERIWRSIKYEEVYLRAYESVHHARTSLGRYIEFYNQTRPHSSLKGKLPSGPHQPPARATGSLTQTERPLRNPSNLFKQTKPPLGSESG